MRAAALVILATLGAGIALAKDWKLESYPDAEWGYKVVLPQRERASKDTRLARYGPDAAQSTTTHTAKFTPPGLDAVLTVTVTEIPEPLRAVPDLVLYEGAGRGLAGPAGFGLALSQREDCEFDAPGGPAKGKALRLFDGKHHVRARVVVHDGRLYQLTAVGTDEAVSGRVAGEFLTKLVLTGRGKP